MDIPLPPDLQDASEENPVEFVMEFFFDQVQFFSGLIRKSFSSGVPVYRALAVEDLSEIRTGDIGESWTIDRDVAERWDPYAQEAKYDRQKDTVVLEGTMFGKDVNWQKTIDRFCNFSVDMNDYRSELELTLDKLGTVHGLRVVSKFGVPCDIPL